jgi:hypothetical protein
LWIFVITFVAGRLAARWGGRPTCEPVVELPIERVVLARARCDRARADLGEAGIGLQRHDGAADATGTLRARSSPSRSFRELRDRSVAVPEPRLHDRRPHRNGDRAGSERRASSSRERDRELARLMRACARSPAPARIERAVRPPVVV